MKKIIQKEKNAFTLIELLTVIAIIGILASMAYVMINPSEQTAKAKDVKTFRELSKARTQSAFFWSNNLSYENVCENLVKLASGGDCEDNEESWAKTGVFTDESKCCADSDGYIGTQKTNISEQSGIYMCSTTEDDGDGDGDEEEDGGCSSSPVPSMCCGMIWNSTTCNNTNGCHQGWMMCVAD